MGHDILVLKAIYQHLGLEERKEGRDRVRGLQNNMVFGGAKPIQKTIDIASAMSAKMSAK
jgi:hypothetical protein